MQTIKTMQTFDSNDYASSFGLPTFNKQLGKKIKFLQHLFILLLKAFILMENCERTWFRVDL